MICFKDCKSQIDLLNEHNGRLSNDLSSANKVIAEYGDIITSLTCKYKDEKLTLLQQVDELQQKVDALELEKAKLMTRIDVHECKPEESNTAVHLSDLLTTSSATDKPDDSDWNNDRQVTHSEVSEVPAKRPYKKHQAHLRKEKNRL